MSINSVNLTGNLTREPELKRTQSGTAVLEMGIAVNERRKVGDEWEDYPNFVDLTMFGKRAEAVANYLTKGMKVSVCGRLHYSSWEKGGQKRSKLSVIVDDIEFMSRNEGAKQQSQEPEPEYVEASVYDEDLPF